jgi:hypothetical protein
VAGEGADSQISITICADPDYLDRDEWRAAMNATTEWRWAGGDGATDGNE